MFNKSLHNVNLNRISYVLSTFPSKTETFVTNQIIYTIHNGYDVNIFTQDLDNISNSSQRDIIEKYDLLNKCTVLPEINHNQIINIFKTLKFIFKNNNSVIFYLLKCISNNNFGLQGFGIYNFLDSVSFINTNSDIYHAQFGPNGNKLANAKSNKAINGKILTTFHGVDAQVNESNKNLLKQRYNSLFKIGDMFTVNTPYLKNILTDIGCPEYKIEILPMGVDTHFFKPKHAKKNRKGATKLLSVGRMLSWKSFDIGLKAVSNLIKDGYDVHYTIIGDGTERTNLLNLAIKLGIKEYVTFTGFLNQESIRNYMQECDIFLMTSTYDQNMRRETQGVVTIEAQACGLPVCAFRSGGVPYTIIEEETGLLADEMDIEQFTNNIRRLISNSNLREYMSYRSRDFVQNNYSISICSQKLISIYSSLMS